MIYLKEVRFRDTQSTCWPFSLPAFAQLEKVTFPTPVTLLCGENGSGKSTLLEAIALSLGMEALGRAEAAKPQSELPLYPFSRSLGTVMSAFPKRKFYLRSEDFFNFVLNLHRQQQDMQQELHRVTLANAHRDQFAQNQARAAYADSLGTMRQLYGEDLLAEASHGERFLRMFELRLRPGGLYLLDEPETPLSPLRQLGLLSMLLCFARQHECQFLIATHSPILLACPQATVYNFDRTPLAACPYEELEGVQLMKQFLQMPQRYLKHL